MPFVDYITRLLPSLGSRALQPLPNNTKPELLINSEPKQRLILPSCTKLMHPEAELEGGLVSIFVAVRILCSMPDDLILWCDANRSSAVSVA
jgi:hypothetical protein